MPQYFKKSLEPKPPQYLKEPKQSLDLGNLFCLTLVRERFYKNVRPVNSDCLLFRIIANFVFY